MDETIGGTSLTRKPKWFLIGCLEFFLILGALGDTRPMHLSGDQTLWNRNSNEVELIGNAIVNQPNETLTADYVKIDWETKKLHAKGNAVFVTKDSVLRGEEFDFDMVTRTGIVRKGRLGNGLFLIQAEEIEKTGEDTYRTKGAEYTTCIDCPSSWSFYAEDVDLTVEGYARMKSVTSRVKEAPVFWFPYLLIPIKRKRQTGLLFPRFSINEKNGFMFVQPFFWAINDSSDMTVGIGRYTRRGSRVEWEGRYALTKRSAGEARAWYVSDSQGNAPKRNRLAFRVSQIQVLPLGIEQKLSVLDATDNLYPIDFSDDIPGVNDPVLSSNLSFSVSKPVLSAFIEARRNRNLLNFEEKVKFDSKTVQTLPSALLTTNDQPIPKTPFVSGVSFGFVNFTRADRDFDQDPFIPHTGNGGYRPGIDPLRRAKRVSIVPSLYSVVRPWDLFSVVPSAQYRSYYYTFGQSAPSLTHGYLHTALELSMEFSRIYERDDPEIPRVKHVVRPTLTYSRIPFTRRPTHPFLQQVEARSGYNFDNTDIVPLGVSPSLVNYFEPQGNSLSYGFVTQIILKKYASIADMAIAKEKENREAQSKGRVFGRPLVNPAPSDVLDPGKISADYSRMFEFAGGQSIDFLELKKDPQKRIPLSRFYSSMDFNFTKLTSRTEYKFYPSLGRYPSIQNKPAGERSPHEASTSLQYVLVDKSHDVFEFKRSINLGYRFSKLENKTINLTSTVVFSINDYLMPSASASYDFVIHQMSEISSTILFRPPSRCWQVAITPSYSKTTHADIKLDFSLNLTGGNYNGVGEIDRFKTN